MSRRTTGRALVCAGIATLLWGALAFTSASLGSPPEEIAFANRRPYNEVKRAAHSAFLPLVARAAAGMALLVLGMRLAGETEDEPRG